MMALHWLYPISCISCRPLIVLQDQPPSTVTAADIKVLLTILDFFFCVVVLDCFENETLDAM